MGGRISPSFVRFLNTQEYSWRNRGHWANYARQCVLLLRQKDTFPWQFSSREDLIQFQDTAIFVQGCKPEWFSEQELEDLLEKVDVEIWKKNPLTYPGRKS